MRLKDTPHVGRARLFDRAGKAGRYKCRLCGRHCREDHLFKHYYGSHWRNQTVEDMEDAIRRKLLRRRSERHRKRGQY